MGADIYTIRHHENVAKIQPLFDAAVIRRNALPEGSRAAKTAQKRVSELYEQMYSVGYFRDSYNNSSLFWQLDLSWWQDVGDMLDDEGELDAAGIKELKALVQSRKPNLDAKLGEMTRENREYFEGKYQTFLNFLDEAVELGEKLECSI